jgi:hypothetical protein
MWRINFFHLLYIEKTDDPGIENGLTGLPVPDERNLSKPSNEVITKKNLAVLAILGVITVLSFFKASTYSSEILLVLVGYLFYLRFKDIVCDFRNMKWQNPHNVTPNKGVDHDTA